MTKHKIIGFMASAAGLVVALVLALPAGGTLPAESSAGDTKTQSAIRFAEGLASMAPDSPDAGDSESKEEALQELYDEGLASVWEEQEVTACLDRVGLSGYSSGFDGSEGQFADVWGGMIIERDQGQVAVQYNVKADPSRVAEFKDKLSVCEGASSKLRVVGRAVEYGEAELRKLAGEIVEGREKWAPQLGIADILSAEVDLRAGVVFVETSQAEEPVIGDRFGVPIRVRGGGAPLTTQLSR